MNERQGGSHTMLNLDPPDHHRLRRLVSKVFTPRMIEALRPRVQELVDEALDAGTKSLAGGDASFYLRQVLSKKEILKA